MVCSTIYLIVWKHEAAKNPFSRKKNTPKTRFSSDGSITFSFIQNSMDAISAWYPALSGDLLDQVAIGMIYMYDVFAQSRSKVLREDFSRRHFKIFPIVFSRLGHGPWPHNNHKLRILWQVSGNRWHRYLISTKWHNFSSSQCGSLFWTWALREHKMPHIRLHV